ncbi:LacI family DNA-binding transcriptional regulator [Verrucomicrobiota bacterium sgz303538]
MRLQDIADAAGVSKATVSLALRNHSSIPPETRARIQNLAQALGYRPNPLVSAPMSYQRATQPTRPTHLTLAMVVNFSRGGEWRHYLSEDLLSSAVARAEQLGYSLEEFWLGDLKMSGQRLSSVLYGRSVPGVLVAPLPAAGGHLQMEWSHFAAVSIGYSLTRPLLHRVTTNRFRAMRMAMEHLRRVGYLRIGLAVHLDQDSRVDHQWSAAFTWEQQQLPASNRTQPLVIGERHWTERAFVKWFNENQPEVILGYNPGIIRWLEKLGKKVPEDVGFVHLWNPDQSGQYAGIYHNPPAIGAAAVDFLVGMIQRNERGLPSVPQALLLDAVWQNGATLKSRKRRATT